MDDNFFALGGHSLLATQLITQISDTFGIELPLPAVFEVSSIRQLASEIEQLIVAKLEMMSDDEVMRLLQ
jgi:acyl carrier protein